MRTINIAAAQMGPIQKADSRQAVIERMLALMREARAQGAELIAFPELTLTTFFPRWLPREGENIERWFESSMPNHDTRPLFDRCRQAQLAMSFGYAELTPEGRRFNTSILTDKEGNITGKYRKVHLPGHAAYDPARSHQHLEKFYFEPGDLGFPVWRTLNGIFGLCICNDRRWPETYRVMGLKGVEVILLGYNTPASNSLSSSEGACKRRFHSSLVVQAGAYQNSTWVVSVAKAGVEDGHPLMAGSLICNPDGEIVAQAQTQGDEVFCHPCDLDATAFGKSTIFDFAAHRRIEHYGLIATQTGVSPPA